MCDGSLQQAMDGTCCGTYICSRQRLRCPTVECTLPSRPNRIRGTSFVETFVCELQILRCLFRTHIGFGDLKLDKKHWKQILKTKTNKSRHCLLHIRYWCKTYYNSSNKSYGYGWSKVCYLEQLFFPYTWALSSMIWTYKKYFFK